MGSWPIAHAGHCLKDGCQGRITVTKVLGPHLIIETNMDIYDRTTTLVCQLSDFPIEVHVEKTR